MKNAEFKMPIQELKVGDKVWNVCGLATISEIVKVGYSETLGSYIHGTTRFSKDSTMTFFISQQKVVLKDGFLCNSDIVQFIKSHKAGDF